jgi:hypothetical protein
MDIEAIAYRDQFRYTNYPFSDAAELETESGFVLPQELFLDASVYVERELVYLKSVIRRFDKITFYLGDDNHSHLSSFSLELNQTTDEEQTAQIHSQTKELRGIIVYDASLVAVLLSLPDGENAFVGNGLPFCLTCYVPIASDGLAAISLVNAYGQTQTLSGNICLVGSNGIILEQKGNVITIHVAGDPLYDRARYGAAYLTPRFLQRIQAVSEDADGGIDQRYELTPNADGQILLDSLGDTLTGGEDADALRISSTVSGLTFSVIGAD